MHSILLHASFCVCSVCLTVCIIRVPFKPGTHLQQSRMSEQLSTKINVGDTVVCRRDVRICCRYVRLCHRFVTSFGDWQHGWIWQLVTVDIITNTVDFESEWFLSPECRMSFRLCRQCVRGQSNTVDFVDFRQSPPCWFDIVASVYRALLNVLTGRCAILLVASRCCNISQLAAAGLLC